MKDLMDSRALRHDTKKIVRHGENHTQAINFKGRERRPSPLGGPGKVPRKIGVSVSVGGSNKRKWAAKGKRKETFPGCPSQFIAPEQGVWPTGDLKFGPAGEKDIGGRRWTKRYSEAGHAGLVTGKQVSRPRGEQINESSAEKSDNPQ